MRKSLWLRVASAVGLAFVLVVALPSPARAEIPLSDGCPLVVVEAVSSVVEITDGLATLTAEEDGWFRCGFRATDSEGFGYSIFVFGEGLVADRPADRETGLEENEPYETVTLASGRDAYIHSGFERQSRITSWWGDTLIGVNVVFTLEAPQISRAIFDASAESILVAWQVDFSEAATEAPERFAPIPTSTSAWLINVGAAVAVGLVLSVLVAIPTGILEAALEGRERRLRTWLRNLLPGPGRHGTHRIASWAARLIRPEYHGRSAVAVFAVAALIATLAEPATETAMLWLRFGSALLAFVVLAAGSSVIGWLASEDRTGEPPKLVARPDYLVLLLLLVVFARVTEIQPALVVGPVLAVVANSALTRSGQVKKFLVGSGYVLVVGLLAWLAYGYVASRGLPADSLLRTAGLDVSSAIAIAALAALPLALLPVQPFGGKLVWDHSKKLWFISYVPVLAAFSLVLARAPFSWSALSGSFAVWLATLIGYFLVSLCVLGIVRWRDRVDAQRECRVDAQRECRVDAQSALQPVEHSGVDR
jgi:hypothetical protein